MVAGTVSHLGLACRCCGHSMHAALHHAAHHAALHGPHASCCKPACKRMRRSCRRPRRTCVSISPIWLRSAVLSALITSSRVDSAVARTALGRSVRSMRSFCSRMRFSSMALRLSCVSLNSSLAGEERGACG